MLIVFATLILGWFLASLIGTWAYFAAEPNDNPNFRVPNWISKR